jgi:L-arabinokinase
MVNRPDEAGSPARRLVFAYYITGHGFGHATRALEVSIAATTPPLFLPCSVPGMVSD